MIEVRLLTLGDPGAVTGGHLYHRRIAERAGRYGARVTISALPGGPFPLAALRARAGLRQVLASRPDVLVVDSIAMWALAAVRPGALGGVPVVGMLHQPPGGIDHGPVRSAVQAVLDRRGYRHTCRLLVASDALADVLVAGGVARDRLTVVPPGCDPAPPPSDRHVDLRQGRRLALVSVGNWVARKGLLDLLDALGRLPDETATLHLVGRTDVEPGYTRRARRRLSAPDLAGRVVVHGPLPDARVAALYSAADAFVLPSRREPYGTVYAEAMAAGLPVVGWRAGNLRYLARDGVEGFVVPTGDLPALAAAVARLAADPGLRDRLGAAARSRAAGFPGWEETTQRFLASLAPSSPRPRRGEGRRGAGRPADR